MQPQQRLNSPAVIMPLKDLLVRKNMAALLISYTIWTDTIFAINSNISQLFIAEIRPGALEFSLYSLAQSLFLLGTSLAFLYIQPHFRIRLETWYIIGLVVTLIIPAWACIGIADVNFGSKVSPAAPAFRRLFTNASQRLADHLVPVTQMRWEFYIQILLLQLAQAFVNGAFRVLLSEMIPIGSEIRWFGMQLVLSCATVWVNYVASAPLQNATHQLRFPLILSVVFLAVAVVLEVARVSLGVFTRDAEKWRRIDKTGMFDEDPVVGGEGWESSAEGEKQARVLSQQVSPTQKAASGWAPLD
jgi:MFS-type transporter involved in bile tolerance (Atg22 family)